MLERAEEWGGGVQGHELREPWQHRQALRGRARLPGGRRLAGGMRDGGPAHRSRGLGGAGHPLRARPLNRHAARARGLVLQAAQLPGAVFVATPIGGNVLAAKYGYGFAGPQSLLLHGLTLGLPLLATVLAVQALAGRLSSRLGLYVIGVLRAGAAWVVGLMTKYA